MALKLEKDSADKLKAIGVKVVENVDKTGFMKAAAPIQDQLAAELGPARGQDPEARPRREVARLAIREAARGARRVGLRSADPRDRRWPISAR